MPLSAATCHGLSPALLYGTTRQRLGQTWVFASTLPHTNTFKEEHARHLALLIASDRRQKAIPESSRMNADDRLSLDPLGRVEGGNRVV